MAAATGAPPQQLLSSPPHPVRGSSPLSRTGTSQSFQRGAGRPQSPGLGMSASTADQESLTLSNTLANSQHAPSQAVHGESSGAGKFSEEWDASQRGSSIVDGPSATHAMERTNSFSGSTAGESSQAISRGNTLRKKSSLRRSGSLKRSGSRRSMRAGSVKSLALQSGDDEDQMHSAFYCPVPTTGNPTETLANRFQAWRKILKDLIAYFREIQNHYEQRGKSLLKLSNVLNNTQTPPGFLTSGGLDEALQQLRNYNKHALMESNKAQEIEEDVILALTGLRSDLQQKIKEIKNLSGDFKNSVDKEIESTKRAVKALQETLGQTDLDASLTTGKQDPYLLRLAVDRQLERQIDEENYLHQAYLNLENSGRELESIVVGEIQKSYNAYAGILKREADAAYSAIDELRVGPIAMPKDQEWTAFVSRDNQFVDPAIPIRSADLIMYPGRDHYAAQEVRAGLLERKSKYLKSYTAGWYVLSPTHLHEFKSADKTQAPITSLYLPEQKLGSHSSQGGSSNKFILKGRQTGGMHRGHTWVFRAESHETMMAWYEDIKALTEKTPQERSDYVRGHSRSFSRSSQHSFSSDGVVDEEDDEPFAAGATVDQNQQQPRPESLSRRPTAGGRFPSDLQVNAQRGLQVPLSPSSLNSGNGQPQETPDHDVIAAAGSLPGSGFPLQSANHQEETGVPYGEAQRLPMQQAHSHAALVSSDAQQDGVNPYTNQAVRQAVPSVPDPSEKIVVTSNPTPDATGGGQGAPVDGNKLAQTELTDYFGQSTFGQKSSQALSETPRTESVRYTPRVGIKRTATGTSVATTPDEAAIRPSMNNARTDSTPTISNLHIPGEYPKAPRN